MGVITANRKTYDHGDLVLTMLGNQPSNFKAAKYGLEQDMQASYGRGNNPNGYSKGPKKYSGSITLGMDELVAIQNVAPGGDITEIRPSQFIFTYLNEDNGIVTDIVTAAFTGASRESNQGDMDLAVELPLLVLGIQFNVKL